MERNTSQGGDGVEQQQAIVLTAEITDAIHGLTDPCGGFGMHHRQDGRLVLLESCFQFVETEGFTPGLFNHLNIGPVAPRHVHQAVAEIPLHRHQHGVTRLNGVGQSGLHCGTSRATHGQRQAIVGLPGVTQQLLHLTHQLHVKRIEMADRSPGQSFQNGGMGIGRAWTQQQPIRRCNGTDGAPMGRVNRKV